MDRAVDNTRQCVLGTREGLPEVRIKEVRGDIRGLRKYERDRLDAGDKMGDELMGGRPSGSGVSDYMCSCVGKLSRVKCKGLPETVK
jgi:hypothetical protein